jgi:hypothetical protein
MVWRRLKATARRFLELEALTELVQFSSDGCDTIGVMDVEGLSTVRATQVAHGDLYATHAAQSDLKATHAAQSDQ